MIGWEDAGNTGREQEFKCPRQQQLGRRKENSSGTARLSVPVGLGWKQIEEPNRARYLFHFVPGFSGITKESQENVATNLHYQVKKKQRGREGEKKESDSLPISAPTLFFANLLLNHQLSPISPPPSAPADDVGDPPPRLGKAECRMLFQKPSMTIPTS